MFVGQEDSIEHYILFIRIEKGVSLRECNRTELFQKGRNWLEKMQMLTSELNHMWNIV